MIDQFVALCFRKRLVVRLIAIFACIFGIYSWTQLAIDAYPLLSPVSVQVTTRARAQRHARAGQHAIDQHVRAVADQSAVS
jgi:Cu/Ag efflux pump CusA